jgi:hypothetical protein
MSSRHVGFETSAPGPGKIRPSRFPTTEEARVLDEILKCVTAGSIVTGVIAVYIALRNNNRQIGAQIFLAYSDRIHRLRNSLPTEADIYQMPEEITGEAVEKARRAVVTSYYLIFEFYSLRRRGYVANAIWSIWEADIARLLSTPAFQQEWPLVRRSFEGHHHFSRWVIELHQSDPNRVREIR